MKSLFRLNHLGFADYFILSIVFIWMIARVYLLGRGSVEGDEFYSIRIIHDPSVLHMLKALGDQADGAPPVYYLMSKLWAVLFTEMPVCLRLFSTACCYAGTFILWVVIREKTSVLSAGLACALVLAHNRMVAFETLSIRFYGLLFLLIAVSTLLAIRFCENVRPSRVLLYLNSFIQAALVLCHPLGVFYGALLMLAVISHDLITAVKIRPIVLVSYFAGWAAILLWFKEFLRQADLNNPSSWVPSPGVLDLPREWHLECNLYYLLAFVGIILALIFLGKKKTSQARIISSKRMFVGNSAHFLTAFSLILALPLFWIISYLLPHNSIFLSRYLIGTLIGWTILIAILSEYLLARAKLKYPGIAVLVAYIFIVSSSATLYVSPIKIIFGIVRLDDNRFPPGSLDDEFDTLNLPIVCPSAIEFLSRLYYSSHSDRYYILVDRNVVLSAKVPHLGTYKILLAIKRNYSDASHIVEANQFLRQNSKFVMLDISNDDWLSLYMKGKSYTVTRLPPKHPLGSAPQGEYSMLLIEQK